MKHMGDMKHIEEWYLNKKVLVTGGAGFIGSHLVDKLVRLGAHVTVLDNLSTGSQDNLKNSLPYISFLQGDVTSTADCQRATSQQEIIFHLAAFVSVPLSFEQASLCNAVNSGGTLKLLQQARSHKISTFIFSSSSAVYGENNVACAETFPVNPQSPYAQSKIDGEKLCALYARMYGISTACLRYFNVCGPRQNSSGHYAAVVPKFIHLLRNKKPLEIYGNGLQTRDFINVDKVVDANLIIGMQPNMIGEVFNIATGKSITLLELIKLLEKKLHTSATHIEFKPARPGDVQHSSADISKYRKITVNPV